VNTSRGFRRAAAVGLLVLAAAAAWRFAALPLVSAWQADRGAVAQLAEQLVRLRALAAAREDYARVLEEERAAPGLASALIEAESPTLAAAQLQQSIKALVEQVGGSVVSSQPTPATAAGPFTRVGIDVRMLLDVDALQRVLHALESQRPVLVVGEMLVLSRGQRRQRRAAAARGPLDVRVEVAGFLAPPERDRAG
jgi:general secretion pathway protein M